MSFSAHRAQPRGRDDVHDARQRILDATVGMAADVGLRSITVRRLCQSADLGTRTFYRYFGDVRGAFLAASLDLHAELRETVDAAHGAHAGPVARAFACIDALIEFVRENPPRAEVLFVEGPAGGAEIDAVRAETVEWAVSLVMGVPPGPRSTAHPAWDRPPDDTTHRLLAEMAVGGVNAMIWRQLIRQDLEPLVAATPYLVETVLRPYEWARRRG
jgi:AcrR family transcriptional regulator